MRTIIFGCGYLGELVAARWQAANHEVVIVTRSSERARSFRQRAFSAITADILRPDTLTGLPAADAVLFAVGYDRASGQSRMEVYAGGVGNVLKALPPNTGRFIYISTTGVYGPSGGDWVDETTPPNPQREGGRASLAAEDALRASPFGARSIILRLAGIYGPGRIPFLKELTAREPVPLPSTGYLNLIHVEDAATVVVAADEHRRNSYVPDGSPQIFCVSDGQPVERREFYNEAARIIGARPPRFAEADPASPRAQRSRGNRRVRNRKMLAELNVTLAYPDYRAGLAAILG